MSKIKMLRTSHEIKPGADNRDDLINLIVGYLPAEDQQACLSKLPTLSARKVELLRDKVARLQAMQMLDAETLALAIERVSFKPAKVAMSDAEFKKEGKNNLVTLKQGPSFFACLKKTKSKYNNGGFGHVSPATSGKNSDAIIWGVKVMHANTKDDFKIAQHEARYNRMMGRDCFMFEFANKPSLLISWQKGVPLNKLEDDNQLANYTFKQRLQWLTSLLEELSKLHKNYFVHFDLQAKNVVVDIDSNKMSLIDYGLSHRENVLDESFTVGEDMRDIAEHIIRILFESEWGKLKDIGVTAIRNLYEATRPFNVESRCTSEQALQYCQQLLGNWNDLDMQKLEAIQAATIDRKNLTVEDVLRGRRLV